MTIILKWSKKLFNWSLWPFDHL